MWILIIVPWNWVQVTTIYAKAFTDAFDLCIENFSRKSKNWDRILHPAPSSLLLLNFNWSSLCKLFGLQPCGDYESKRQAVKFDCILQVLRLVYFIVNNLRVYLDSSFIKCVGKLPWKESKYEGKKLEYCWKFEMKTRKLEHFPIDRKWKTKDMKIKNYMHWMNLDSGSERFNIHRI